MRTKSNQKCEVADYTDLRSRLIQRGYTLRSFALKRGLSPSSVYDAARRVRRGVKSTRIYNQLVEVANGK